VDQKYYRNKMKNWGEGQIKQPEVNEEITIPTKHKILKQYTQMLYRNLIF